VEAPQNSIESQEDIDFESSSASSMDMIPQPQTRKQKKEMKAVPEKIVKESLDLHGFNMDILRAYPHMLKDGECPTYLMDKKLEEDITKIDKMISFRIKQEFKNKELFPSIKHI
jgi:hypothetical protein